jgi:hypothetical protein
VPFVRHEVSSACGGRIVALPVSCSPKLFLKCLFNSPDFTLVLSEYILEHSSDVGITGNLTFCSISLCIDEMCQKGFNIFQVVDSLDSKDDEAIPSACMSVSEVPIDAPKEIARKSNVV